MSEKVTQAVNDVSSGKYDAVAAEQETQTLGVRGGAVGDFIEGILIIPSSTSPGPVTLFDNENAITIFVGGANSLSNLVPFYVPLGLKSVNGGFKITTGVDVQALATGNFT